MAAAPNCWIGVAARSHVMGGKAGGFVMFAHGKHSAVRQTRPGDWFAYYSPTQTLGGKDGVRRFTGIGTIADSEPEQTALMGAQDAWLRRAHYLDAQEADIYLLLPQFGFVSDHSHWGMYFRKSLFKVSAADFSIIAGAMGVGSHFNLGD